jgi:hypothetical protein
MYKWPQPLQGTHKHYLWDGWALSVGINDWRIICSWWCKQGVKCKDELGAIEETWWGKVDVVGIIGWGGRNVSWQSIQVITISIFGCDIHRHFDDGEIAGLAMPIHINERNLKP